MKPRRPTTVIDHLFSRGVLGSMLVGTAAGKVVEKTILLIAPAVTWARLMGWSVTLLLFVGLYVYWADFEEFVDNATGGEDDE